MSATDYPQNTTGYERRIREYATEHALPIDRFKRRSLAALLCKRGARMSDLDLERIFMHSDPTPRDAIRNIEAEAVMA